jgi:hypothetical protein
MNAAIMWGFDPTGQLTGDLGDSLGMVALCPGIARKQRTSNALRSASLNPKVLGEMAGRPWQPRMEKPL